MSRLPWRDHVVIDKDVHHGEPCIRGTRIPVRMVLGSLAEGLSSEEILREYPQLSQQDVLGALSYAADVLGHEALLPLTPPKPADAHQGR